MIVIKCRVVFYFIAGIIAAVFAALFVVFSGVLQVVAAVLGIAAEVLWSVYFSTFRYCVCREFIVIKSGIFIKRTKKIALSDVVFETRLAVGKTVFLTVLRTAGGKAILFGRLNRR